MSKFGRMFIVLEITAITGEIEGTRCTEKKGSDKIYGGSESPKKSPAKSRYGYDTVSQQIIEAEYGCLEVFGCKIHDKGFPCRLPELLEAAQDEGEYQQGKGLTE